MFEGWLDQARESGKYVQTKSLELVYWFVGNASLSGLHNYLQVNLLVVEKGISSVV